MLVLQHSQGQQCPQNNLVITLSASSNNIVTSNNASYNELAGIELFNSNNNAIKGNRAEYNELGGLVLSGSSNNTIHHNSFVDNVEVNAIDNGTNEWDNGTFGNYYSDFNCTDSDGDGICDSVYRIFGGESVDRYPLAKPPT